MKQAPVGNYNQFCNFLVFSVGGRLPFRQDIGGTSRQPSYPVKSLVHGVNILTPALDPNPIGRAYRRDLSIVITKPLKSHQVQVKNWNSWTLCRIAGITLYSIISRREVLNQKSNGAFVGNIDKVSINHFNSPCGGRSLPTPQSPFGRQVGTTRNAHEYGFSRQRNGTDQQW